MIEIVPYAGGYRWRWLSAEGRILLAPPDAFACTASAWEAARRVRIAFWAFAAKIDHRQAACI